MGRAERIVGRREQAIHDATVAARAAQQQRLDETREDLLREIDVLVPAALKAVEARDFEDGRIVRVERKGWFGGFKKVKRAGWLLATWNFPWKDTQGEGTVWLLSDGKLATSALSALGDLDRKVLLRGGPAWAGWPYERVRDALRGLVE
ncbi:MAG TPA: hypothetical protein VFJ64_04990 [Solirubrobacterales bacterium]|nr:hypothetical protein [Solirubrobacterales bacterium]